MVVVATGDAEPALLHGAATLGRAIAAQLAIEDRGLAWVYGAAAWVHRGAAWARMTAAWRRMTAAWVHMTAACMYGATA